jgi:hypothetical protein
MKYDNNTAGFNIANAIPSPWNYPAFPVRIALNQVVLCVTT